MPLDQDDQLLIDPPKRDRQAERDRDVDDLRMPLGDHIEELRRRLIISLLALGVAAGGMLFVGKELVRLLLLPLGQVQQFYGIAQGAVALGIPTGFAVYLKVSLIAGLIVASPIVVWQLWKFVSAGLYRHEQRFFLIVAPLSTLMSLLAAGFTYFVMLPICLLFLLKFTISFPPIDPGATGEGGPSLIAYMAELMGDSETPNPADDVDTAQLAATPAQLPMLRRDPATPESGQAWIKLPENELRIAIGDRVYRFKAVGSQSAVAPVIDVNQYISFVVLLTLGVLIAFQLPVVMLVMGASGLVRAEDLRRFRKYALFVAFALGALLTPADPVSMFVLALPLYGLFEVGLLLMGWAASKPPDEL